MRFLSVFLTILGFIMGCNMQKNPLLEPFNTPFATPPFNLIQKTHFKPAFMEGIKQQKTEIETIVNNPQEPTFKNTVEALENCGQLLKIVSSIFGTLNSSLTDDEMQSIAKDISPIITQNSDDIWLNKKLFLRVKKVYDNQDNFQLNSEQQKLLDEYYKTFVRGGANLDEQEKSRLREINKELSLLSLKFSENVLKETNKFELVLDNENDLAGLPKDVVTAAAETAKENGYEGKWVFTIHKPSLIPFLQFSDKREFREILFKAYISKGNHEDELDNKEILSKMAALRAERAKLLGYKTHAHFILEKNMAKVPENVYSLLDQLWKPALKRAKAEAKELQRLIHKDGHDFQLQPWDWWYYAEKLKKEKFDLDDESLRPYFELDKVIDGAFMVANKLYGLSFEERTDIPVYHNDVRVYEVKNSDGSHVGILYTDYFPRASKRGGAWMNALRKQEIINNENIRPIVTNNGNFTKPTSEKPSLLSLDEVTTLFHEFGHALHGLLSNCTYYSLSGTDVPRDFVELPSQIMENWATHPQVLKLYAKHYKTGEVIPQDLVDKIEKSGHFNQGFATVEYLAASYLDMDWHVLEEPTIMDAKEFEDASMKKIGLIPEIVVRYKSPYFQHIFAGGYSSGYYSYIWAEVLDADAFQAFKETDIFDAETAKSFRENILEKGGTQDPMVLYRKFRGKEPRINALLKRRGLL